MTTTIKVTNEVRDRLKAQATREHRTLGEHLAHLADLGDRRARFDALREAISATPDDVMDAYWAEVGAWDRVDRD
jgi:predicted DNA-binding protein